jgi:hypothetical protein
MAYRRPDPERAEASRAQHDARAQLRELAADGQAAAGHVASDRDARRRAAVRAEERRRFKLLAQACMHGARWHLPLVLVSVLGLCGGGALLMALGGGTTASVVVGVGLIWLGAGIPFAVVALMRTRVVAAERARVAALPFELAGWERALGVDPRSGTLTLTLAFAGEPPERDLLEGLCGRLDATLREAAGRGATIVSAELSADGGDGPDTNAMFYRWLRRAIDDVLVPLHRGYPLARVEVIR